MCSSVRCEYLSSEILPRAWPLCTRILHFGARYDRRVEPFHKPNDDCALCAQTRRGLGFKGGRWIKWKFELCMLERSKTVELEQTCILAWMLR